MDARGVRVERHESVLATWEMAHAAPTRALRPHVARYCGYREASVAGPMRRREVPSGVVTLILSLGPSIDVLDAREPGATRATCRSFVAALHDRASLTEYSGEQHGVELKLTPLGAHRLLGLPMHELTNQVVALDDVWGRTAELLTERLHETPGWAERFDVVDSFLAARLAEAREPSLEVAWAWGRLRASQGRVAIRSLVEELGWSHRRLIAAFREQVGLAPKSAGRILRFERVVERLRAQGGARLGEIALDSGYYDQAHLNRDFREFAATTPREYVARLLPDGGGVAG